MSLPDGFDAWFARATAVHEPDRHAQASVMIAELAGVLRVALPWSARGGTPPLPVAAGTPTTSSFARELPLQPKVR